MRLRRALLLVAAAVIACAPVEERRQPTPLGAPTGSDEPAAGESPAIDMLSRIDSVPLEIGARTPDFALIDHLGMPIVHPAEGKAIVVTFFETRSPDPDLCPELIRRLTAVGKALRPELAARLRLIAISVDPRHDTAAVLRHYADERAIDGGTLRLATGEPDGIAALARRFGVVTWGREDGSVAHSLNTFVIDRNGRLIDRFPGVDAWTAADLLAAAAAAAR